MYDMLTREQLSHLHEAICLMLSGIFDAMFGPDFKPLMEVGGQQWKILKAKRDELDEFRTSVFAEIERRDAEARADA